MSKWYQNGVEGIKVLMRILEGQRRRPHHNLTIYDETKFSSCHTPCINSILHPASSYCFLSHKRLFQAGNFNVNVRPDLMYFSIWGVYSKTYKKDNLWPMKTAKTLCTSLRRLVWWNVIHSTKISVVLLVLKAKGQKLMFWYQKIDCLISRNTELIVKRRAIIPYYLYSCYKRSIYFFRLINQEFDFFFI